MRPPPFVVVVACSNPLLSVFSSSSLLKKRDADCCVPLCACARVQKLHHHHVDAVEWFQPTRQRVQARKQVSLLTTLMLSSALQRQQCRPRQQHRRRLSGVAASPVTAQTTAQLQLRNKRTIEQSVASRSGDVSLRRQRRWRRSVAVPMQP